MTAGMECSFDRRSKVNSGSTSNDLRRAARSGGFLSRRRHTLPIRVSECRVAGLLCVGVDPVARASDNLDYVCLQSAD